MLDLGFLSLWSIVHGVEISIILWNAICNTYMLRLWLYLYISLLCVITSEIVYVVHIIPFHMESYIHMICCSIQLPVLTLFNSLFISILHMTLWTIFTLCLSYFSFFRFCMDKLELPSENILVNREVYVASSYSFICNRCHQLVLGV